MERDKNRKLKLLKLLEILQRETDEQHPMKTTDICRRMEDMDISCDRRILASEIQTLREQGYEIQQCQVGRAKGYFIADRAFKVPELRMLLDAVEASQLLTEKKTQELKDKIVSLSSDKQAEILKSTVVRFNSAKSTNERIYHTIGTLEEAIRKKKKVTIRYFHLNEQREKVYRSENGIHTVEPIALVYNNDKYYLTCYNPVADKNYNYRLDRIEWVEILKEKINKNAVIRSRSVAKYTAQVFKMYGGETVNVTLAFDAHMIDYIYEKFGMETKIFPLDNEEFTTNVDVQLSPTFWGWVFQFTGKMKITAPEWVREEYIEMLKKAIGEQT